MINSGAKVNQDGTFSISILSGHIYEVGVQLPRKAHICRLIPSAWI